MEQLSCAYFEKKKTAQPNELFHEKDNSVLVNERISEKIDMLICGRMRCDFHDTFCFIKF